MENKHFVAKEGKTFLRLKDGYRMGDEMYLGLFIDGTEDVIENYIEVDKLPEELENDNKMKQPKDNKRTNRRSK